jgi:hypothetical protein
MADKEVKKTPREWAQALGVKRGVAGACKLRGWGRDELVTEREFYKAVRDYRGMPIDGQNPRFDRGGGK